MVATKPTASECETGPFLRGKSGPDMSVISLNRTIDLTTRPRRSPLVSVIVPTRNEAENLPTVLGAIPAEYEVVIVDGHSTDGTLEVAARLRPDAVLLTQTRRGKGNAMACGFAAATGDILVMLDADGSADPLEIPRFVRALEEGADFAKGTRFAAGGGSSDITRLRRLGNKALNGIVNTVYRTAYSDLCYGYNAFWRHCLPVLELSPGATGDEMLWGDGFEIETLINIRVAQAGLKVVEVPSYEADRLHGVSNLNAFSDGLRVLRTIAAEKRTQRQRALAGAAVAARPSVVVMPDAAVPAQARHKVSA
jgi:glycosyltransferase involved in cell wall biosynthesis